MFIILIFFLKLLNFSSQSFNLFLIELGIIIKNLNLESFFLLQEIVICNSLCFINIPQLIILHFELFKHSLVWGGFLMRLFDDNWWITDLTQAILFLNLCVFIWIGVG